MATTYPKLDMYFTDGTANKTISFTSVKAKTDLTNAQLKTLGEKLSDSLGYDFDYLGSKYIEAEDIGMPD